MSFVEGRLYPLTDPTRYDDELGEGYSFAKPADGCGGYILTDCWIVNAKEEVHPGYAESPVPVRYQDVYDDPMKTLRAMQDPFS